MIISKRSESQLTLSVALRKKDQGRKEGESLKETFYGRPKYRRMLLTGGKEQGYTYVSPNPPIYSFSTVIYFYNLPSRQDLGDQCDSFGLVKQNGLST